MGGDWGIRIVLRCQEERNYFVLAGINIDINSQRGSEAVRYLGLIKLLITSAMVFYQIELELASCICDYSAVEQDCFSDSIGFIWYRSGPLK